MKIKLGCGVVGVLSLIAVLSGCASEAAGTTGDEQNVTSGGAACAAITAFEGVRSKLENVDSAKLPPALEDFLEAETIEVKKFATADGDVYAFYSGDGVSSEDVTGVTLADAKGNSIAAARVKDGKMSWLDDGGKALACSPAAATKECATIATFEGLGSKLKNVDSAKLPPALEDFLEAETIEVKKFATANGDVYAFYSGDGVSSKDVTGVVLADAKGNSIAGARVKDGKMSWLDDGGKAIACSPAR